MITNNKIRVLSDKRIKALIHKIKMAITLLLPVSPWTSTARLGNISLSGLFSSSFLFSRSSRSLSSLSSFSFFFLSLSSRSRCLSSSLACLSRSRCSLSFFFLSFSSLKYIILSENK